MSSEQGRPDPEVLVALNRAATSPRLLSGAVHEVNNALQVISGSVELLEQQASLPPGVAKSLDRIRRQSERAAGALAELQAFTKAPLEERERLSLREVVQRAIALRRYAAGRLGLAIELAGNERSLDLIVGNGGYIEQAVLNLLVNAEQAMSGGGGSILVTLRDEPDRVGVEVRDTGPGLADQARARLFEPFATTKPPTEGAGLGLWAARAIVTSCGGSLEIDSAPGGTAVVLWFPRD